MLMTSLTSLRVHIYTSKNIYEIKPSFSNTVKEVSWVGARTLGLTTFNITTLSIKGLFVTLSSQDTRHNKIVIILSVIMLSVVMLNVVMLSVVLPSVLVPDGLQDDDLS